MLGLCKKIFGTAQSRKIRHYRKIVQQINAIEENYQKCSNEEIQNKVQEFRVRLKNGEKIDDLLPEAYALVKNTCRRLIGIDVHVSGYNQKWDMIPYDVQIVGAISMHYGSIAEMMTGEGKTLTAAMPLFLNSLTGKAVHLVTVNDYLAQRDCEWIGEIFRWLGLTVQALTSQIPLHDRKEIYRADIVYGTASEFGFDYLRDNSMAHSPKEQSQRGYYFAIIDEIDSILIDEARTPLIISGPAAQSSQMYEELKEPVARIVRLQRDQCNKLASDARGILEKLGLLEERKNPCKLSKKEEKEREEAFRNLWLVGKGAPRNKILKRLKENPDIRVELEKWETYLYSDSSKKERYEILAKLYIIIDERANEYELTDKGIGAWTGEKGRAEEDFTLLDLGYEYAKIDENEALSEQEKMQKKVLACEEDSCRKERFHNLRQLFRAHLLMEKDIDYIVQEQKIVIIDGNTGRPQPGRRFSDGLHQSIEAKEGVPIQQETQTYAAITLQNYFRMYTKLAGMTGTAMTEAHEFKEIYKIDVVEIPTYKTCIRHDAHDVVYMTEREKYHAIVKDIVEIHGKGRPILIGTDSVETSEKLSRILKQNKLLHVILNAKNHEKEAEIVAQAGRKGAITVATNMAGRGTDIKLAKGVAELGGLHVIGITRNQSRRIDRQLRGRCARQGDAGTSKFYVSFEDPLMRLFTSPKLFTVLQRIRPPEGEPISAKVLDRSIETAQKRMEQRNYSIRKHTLQYDDVMNKQRQEVYAFRNTVLCEEDSMKIAKEILENASIQIVKQHFSFQSNELHLQHCIEKLMSLFPVTFDQHDFDNGYVTAEQAGKQITEKVLNAFEHKIGLEIEAIESLQENENKKMEVHSILREIIRNLCIRDIDQYWQSHLLAIDHLRIEVNMRVIGQKDPLCEFNHEAFCLFDSFYQSLTLQISQDLFKFEILSPQKKKLFLQSVQHHKRLKKFRKASHLGLHFPSRPVRGTNL